MRSPEKYYNQSILRAADILEAVGREESPVSLTDLSRMIGLHKSTVHRLALSLESRGWLMREQESGKYRIGIKFLTIARSADEQSSIRAIHPMLLQLVEAVQETTILSLWDEKGVICVDKVEASRKLQISSHVGQYFPIYAGATGFAVLIGMPDNMAQNILSEVELTPFTPKTITSKERLWERYKEMKAQGYVLSSSQVDPGVTGIAMPLYLPYEQSYGSLGVSLPDTRADEETVNRILTALRSSIEIIRTKLDFFKRGKNMKQAEQG